MPKITKIKLGNDIYDISDKNAVSVLAQTLTAEQKAQARTNIDALANPASAGTEGQALVLNGDGNPVWGDVAVENATSTVAGIAKLYDNVNDENTDGAPSQKAVNDAIEANKFGAVVDEDQEMASFIQGIGTQVAGPDTYGAIKMFDTVDGNSTEGTVTQKAINDAIKESQASMQMTVDPNTGELVIGAA